jgi:hypothetical protein
VQEQSRAPSPGPSCLQPAESDGVDVDSESDTGAPDSWDPHAGLKPSEMDGCASDADVEMEDELPPGGEEEVNAAMVELMIKLEGCDERDEEWLPPKEKRKVMARKKGMISFAPRPRYQGDLPTFREKKGPLPWA